VSKNSMSGPRLTRRFYSEFASWLAMRQRCSNSNTVGWNNYGGRGIKVCHRWQNSFAAFLKDMGPKPSAKHSIDRKDHDGNYEPDNCRWATKHEQARNCRSNRYVTFRGETLCVSAWAERTGLSANLVRARLNLGWDVEKTLTTPHGAKRKDSRELTFCGETRTVKAWARIVGIDYRRLLQRIDSGWSAEAALTLPLGTIYRTRSA